MFTILSVVWNLTNAAPVFAPEADWNQPEQAPVYITEQSQWEAQHPEEFGK